MLDFNPMNEPEKEGMSEFSQAAKSSSPEDNLHFDLPVNQSSVIKVIGVGGGGSNAVNYMYSQGIHGVDFVVCNTDSQALHNSPVPNKIQLGVHLTEGLGAGADPTVGEESAKENLEEIRSILEARTKMVFITAGMGGGTGTGAAPIIARQAKELGILTVGIVTIPFQFEGKMRMLQAEKGVEELRSSVDSLIVINNNKLRDVYGNLGFKAGFGKADEVLAIAAKGIAEVITHHFQTNIDLKDAQTVLKDSGTAIMGSATSSGNERAGEAVSKALDSPLLNDNRITGAKNVLLLIISGQKEITIDEIGEISDYIQQEAGGSANIIMGIGEDNKLEDEISVTVVATGFHCKDSVRVVTREPEKIVHTLDDEEAVSRSLSLDRPDLSEEKLEMKDEEADSGENLDALVFDTEEHPRHETQEPIAEEAEKERTVFVLDDVEDEVPMEFGLFAPDMGSPIQEESSSVDMKTVSEQTNFQEQEDEAVPVMEEEVIVHSLAFEEEEESEETPISFDSSEEKEESELMTFMLRSEEEKEEEVRFERQLLSDNIEVVSEDQKTETESSLEDNSPETEPHVQARQEETLGDKQIFTVRTSEPEESKEDVGTARMRRMTEERKIRLKDFNYKFRNTPNGIEKFENVPAYKRMNIDLENTPASAEEPVSRFTLGESDEDGDTNLRSRNSFLHDNVD